MNKKLIRLTESDLHRIVKESVNKILNEVQFGGGSWAYDNMPQVNNYIRDNITRSVQGIMQACQKYLQNNDESVLSYLYWACSAFGESYDNAWKNGQEIYGGMNFRQS
jgi:hypothetical protein